MVFSAAFHNLLDFFIQTYLVRVIELVIYVNDLTIWYNLCKNYEVSFGKFIIHFYFHCKCLV